MATRRVRGYKHGSKVPRQVASMGREWTVRGKQAEVQAVERKRDAGKVGSSRTAEQNGSKGGGVGIRRVNVM